MKQKDYNMEIANVLARGKNHLRGISNVLGINHRMVVMKKRNMITYREALVISEGEAKECIENAEKFVHEIRTNVHEIRTGDLNEK